MHYQANAGMYTHVYSYNNCSRQPHSSSYSLLHEHYIQNCSRNKIWSDEPNTDWSFMYIISTNVEAIQMNSGEMTALSTTHCDHVYFPFFVVYLHVLYLSLHSDMALQIRSFISLSVRMLFERWMIEEYSNSHTTAKHLLLNERGSCGVHSLTI